MKAIANLTSTTSVPVLELPLTKVAVFDSEGLTVDMRWDAELPLYCLCVLVVNEGKKRMYKIRDTSKAIVFMQKLIDDGYFCIAHNAKFDYSTLKARGLSHVISDKRFSIGCTQTMAYIQDSTRSSYSLAMLTGAKDDVIGDLITRGLYTGQPSEFWSTDHRNSPEVLDAIVSYCANDVLITWKLYKTLAEWFNSNPKFIEPLLKIEFPMLEVLSLVEARGATIDGDALQKLTHDLELAIGEATATIENTYGLLPELQWDEEAQEYKPKEKVYKSGSYNNRSNAAYYMDASGCIVCSDSARIYNHCKLVRYNSAAATGHTWWLLKRTAPHLLELADETETGKRKLDKGYFENVSDQMPDNLPIARLIKLKKLLTFCNTLDKHKETKDGRIHASYQSTRTRTTRLSCTSPNLQQIPRPTGGEPATDYGMRLRSLFIASESNVLLCADLDRIECVVLAWYLAKVMGDKGLQNTVNSGEDIHQANADLWGVTRNVAKTLIFLLVYGGGAGLIYKRGMSKSLREAEAMFNGVHKSQPSIQKLKDKAWAQCRKRGYLTNPFGAHGLYPELDSRNNSVRSRGERQSFNYLIQKTARDVYSMLLVASVPIVLKYNGSFVNLVHDEVLLEFPNEHAEQAQAELNIIWQKRMDILPGICINGDWNIGNNWYQAK